MLLQTVGCVLIKATLWKGAQSICVSPISCVTVWMKHGRTWACRLYTVNGHMGSALHITVSERFIKCNCKRHFFAQQIKFVLSSSKISVTQPISLDLLGKKFVLIILLLPSATCLVLTFELVSTG